jgi:uncharacterized membrane protein
MHYYFPLTGLFLLLCFVLLVLAIAIIELRILSYAYERIGINRRYVFGLLLLSLLGSSINIRVTELPPEKKVAERIVTYYGVDYVVPVEEERPGTIIAVNVGGALVPTALSIYLLIKNRLYLSGLVGTAVVAGIVHLLAQPVRGVGISVPIFIPPLLAAGTAMLLSWRHAPALAYIVGSLGTLIGADLMNLGKIQGLGAPVASIGGAGTFDGIFVTGILAVLLAAVVAPSRAAPRRNQTFEDSRSSWE